MIKSNIFFLKIIKYFEISHSCASFCEAKSCLLKLWKVHNIKHFLRRHFEVLNRSELLDYSLLTNKLGCLQNKLDKKNIKLILPLGSFFIESFQRNNLLVYVKLLLVESSVIVIFYVIFLMHYAVIINYFGKKYFFQLRENRA